MRLRKALALPLLLGAGLSLSGCALENGEEEFSSKDFALSATNGVDRAELAYHWAPVHYQDVDQTGSHALGGKSDYLTRVDFDGDWQGKNNWQNAGKYPFSAHVYFSVVETSSHWFLTYLFFHPRNWSDSFFDTEHENDAEGVLLTVARDGSTFGALKSAITVAHKDFFSYVPSGGNWTSGGESVDGTLSLANFEGSGHPVTAQEAKGHGLKARPYYDIVGDGLVYYPSRDSAEEPSSPDDRDVRYRLIDIFEPGGLWDRRNDAATFASWGSFAGDKSDGCGAGTIGCDQNAANAPWGWDDHDDVPGRGELASDPARVVSEYFRIPETLSRTYTFNPYR
jgi:hypothetical protein